MSCYYEKIQMNKVMADNVVILHARFVKGGYREADMVYGRGIAYSSVGRALPDLL